MLFCGDYIHACIHTYVIYIHTYAYIHTYIQYNIFMHTIVGIHTPTYTHRHPTNNTFKNTTGLATFHSCTLKPMATWENGNVMLHATLQLVACIILLNSMCSKGPMPHCIAQIVCRAKLFQHLFTIFSNVIHINFFFGLLHFTGIL